MNRRLKDTILLGLALMAIHCGSVNLGAGGGNGVDSSVATGITPPVISTIAPATASIAGGTTVTLSGFGYSSIPEANIVTIGAGTTSTATSALTYALVAPATATDIEAITFKLPTGTPLGVQNVFVTVFNKVSNANLTLTVTP